LRTTISLSYKVLHHHLPWYIYYISVVTQTKEYQTKQYSKIQKKPFPVAPSGSDNVAFLWGEKIINLDEYTNLANDLLAEPTDTLQSTKVAILQSISGSGKTKFIVFLAQSKSCWVIYLNCDQITFLKEKMNELSTPFLQGEKGIFGILFAYVYRPNSNRRTHNGGILFFRARTA
jgi:hypothetical protein